MNFTDCYGPWAIIAGASEGIGRALAKQIAAQGLDCILNAATTSAKKCKPASAAAFC